MLKKLKLLLLISVVFSFALLGSLLSPEALLATEEKNILRVSIAGNGSGRVLGYGINCGNDCSEAYLSGPGELLIPGILVIPASGSVFAGWSGDCAGPRTVCFVRMDRDRRVTAIFNTVLVTPPDPTPLPVQEDPASGTLSVDRATVGVGESFTVTIVGQDDNGLEELFAHHQGRWHGRTVTGTSATETFTFNAATIGTYTIWGSVRGRKRDDTRDAAVPFTRPVSVTVTVTATPGEGLPVILTANPAS